GELSPPASFAVMMGGDSNIAARFWKSIREPADGNRSHDAPMPAMRGGGPLRDDAGVRRLLVHEVSAHHAGGGCRNEVPLPAMSLSGDPAATGAMSAVTGGTVCYRQFIIRKIPSRLAICSGRARIFS